MTSSVGNDIDLGIPDPAECPECGSPFHRTLIRFEVAGEFFGYFPADVCDLNHDYLTEEANRAIDRIAEARGLVGGARAVITSHEVYHSLLTEAGQATVIISSGATINVSYNDTICASSTTPQLTRTLGHHGPHSPADEGFVLHGVGTA